MSKIGLANCSLHVKHEPAALTSENHHVEPQAWQLFKATGDAENARQLERHLIPAQVMLSADYRPQMAGALYNDHTVRVAPTCHRNVHFWIVKVMKMFEQLAKVHSPEAVDEEVLLEHAIREVRSLTGVRGMVFQTAILAPSMHIENGGSLRKLVGARLYGQA